MGTLTQAEGEAIVIYAQAFARKRSAEKDIAVGGVTTTCGTGGLKPHPALGVIRDAEATMMRLLSEFGLTPASRSKVKAKVEGPKDALGEFLNRRKKVEMPGDSGTAVQGEPEEWDPSMNLDAAGE
jgi:P27 family predicted phage terminase small subunit